MQELVDVVTASSWVYALIAAVAAVDAFFPLVPSEATVIAAASLAAGGELSFATVLVAGACGAIVGDNTTYLAGRAAQGLLRRRLDRSSKRRERIERAEAGLRHRAGTIIVVSRFLPGGRTLTMLSAGIAGLGWRRFAAYDVAAGVFWAGYAGAIGWVGGRTFADRPLHGLVLALALAAALTLFIEGGRRIVVRWGRGPMAARRG